MSIAKRIALITGGMGGIGTSISQRLYKEGFIVVVTCTPGSNRRDQWLDEQLDAGFEFHCVECDITDWASTCNAFESVRQNVGPVDVLINNAGITRDGSFRKMTAAIRDDILESMIASTPVGRLGHSQEVASIVAWLASSESAYATGADFSVNGGMNMQ